MSDFDLDHEEDSAGPPSAPFWMTTFSDMVTLLLTFFVLIVSMSTVEIRKFTEALSYFQGQTSILINDAAVPPASRPTVNRFQSREQAERYAELLDFLHEEGLSDKVQLNLTDRGLHVTITDSVMFESGSADLIDKSRVVLRRIRAVLGTAVESVVVEGHTDDRPIHTAMFPSNWELSSGRAASVVRFLLEEEDHLPPSRYLAVGYGEHRPVESNATAAGRARNRRVEILFSWETWQNNPISGPIQTQTSL